MACDDLRKDGRKNGPSTLTLTFSGIVAIAGMLATGFANYNALQTDIASLKRGEVYQERVNDQLREELKAVRAELKDARSEQHIIMKEIGEKIDRLIENWPNRRRG